MTGEGMRRRRARLLSEAALAIRDDVLDGESGHAAPLTPVKRPADGFVQSLAVAGDEGVDLRPMQFVGFER